MTDSPPPDWPDERTPTTGPVPATLRDHEKRMREIERCSRDTAHSLSELESAIEHVQSAVDVTAKDSHAMLRWAIGIAVGAFVSIAIAAVGIIFKAGAVDERLNTTATGVALLQEQQSQQRNTLDEVRDTLTEVASDGRNQRASNTRRLEKAEEDLRDHAAMRRH